MRLADLVPRQGLGGEPWQGAPPLRRAPRRLTLPPPEARHVAVSGDTQGVVHRHEPADRTGAPTARLLLGLEASSESHSMRERVEKAWHRGFIAVRLNSRTRRGTEHHTPGLFHSGLTADRRTSKRSHVSSRTRPPGSEPRLDRETGSRRCRAACDGGRCGLNPLRQASTWPCAPCHDRCAGIPSDPCGRPAAAPGSGHPRRPERLHAGASFG